MSTPLVEDSEYRLMRAVEDRHWWFDGMEQITARLFAELALPPRERCEILDAGCGTGRNLGFLNGYGNVTGLDYSSVAVDCCRERGFEKLVCASVNELPFADGQFNLVTSFDVIVTAGVDDKAALAEAWRVLKPGGWFFIRVAAYDWLRARHDAQWHVAHRYVRGELRAKLMAAGFQVHTSSYANMWLLPVALLKRWSERLVPPREESDLQAGTGGRLNGLLEAILASEARLIATSGLPCGLSLLALARKE